MGLQLVRDRRGPSPPAGGRGPRGLASQYSEGLRDQTGPEERREGFPASQGEIASKHMIQEKPKRDLLRDRKTDMETKPQNVKKTKKSRKWL